LQTFPHFEPRFERQDWVLPRILERQARERPDAPFLQWTDASDPLSFAEVNAQANRIAHGLADLGVGHGDFVAIYLPNCLEYPLYWFGLNKLGAAEVTIGPEATGSFLRHPLALAKARMVLTTPGLAARIAELEHELPDIQQVVLLDDPEEGDVAPPSFDRIAVTTYDAMLSANDSDPGIEVSPRDAAAVLFTSGTTGPSKAVLMPHSQLYWFAEEMIQVCRLTQDDVYLTGFPFFHANAQLESIYPALAMGIRCVLYRRFSATDWIGRIRRSGATVTNLLGATMAFVASQPLSDDDRDHKLRCIFAAPVPDALTGKVMERYGVEAVTTGFGQTEIAMPFLSPWGQPIPAGACGVLLDQWYEVKLEDPATGEAITGAGSGELLLRHKVPGIISDGFFGMPEKTVEAWHGLWFHTGDLLRRDSDGWYYFVDRLKDTLRRRGENVSSFEVEDTVRSHPAVAECACIGVPADEEGGEQEVMVFVVAADGMVADPAEIIAWCAPRMPRFALPRYVEITQALPQTPSGKVKKGELRNLGVTSTTWDASASAKGRNAA
jgi:crotonobetaine/carnitine-CoA ligase